MSFCLPVMMFFDFAAMPPIFDHFSLRICTVGGV